MAKSDYYEALHKCGLRYATMVADENYWGTPDSELNNFIRMFLHAVELRNLPLMKLNRWLGYIQGVLINKGLTTVKAERDWTRPLFRPLDFPDEQN